MAIHRAPLPILHYSHVDYSYPDSSFSSRFFPWITPTKFERHLKILSRLGYTALTFDEASKLHFQRKTIPRKSLVLTFEGGMRSFFLHALPLLKKHGARATVFLATRTIGNKLSTSGENGLPPLDVLSTFMIKESAEKGIEFGIHGSRYRDLVGLDHVEIWQDLEESSTAVSELIRTAPVTFAYPFGRYNRQIIRLVLEKGFHGACTLRPGIDGPGIGLLTEEENFVFGRYSIDRAIGFLRFFLIISGLKPFFDWASGSRRDQVLPH
ncbi:polysaccharide deacetylase family protein [Acidobacteriota bacterium]